MKTPEKLSWIHKTMNKIPNNSDQMKISKNYRKMEFVHIQTEGWKKLITKNEKKLLKK